MQTPVLQHEYRYIDSLHKVPVIIAALASIVAIAAAFFYENPYLSIPPGVGLLCCMHHMYLAYQNGKLASLSAQINKFDAQIKTHEQLVQEGKKQLSEQQAEFDRQIAIEKALIEEKNQEIDRLMKAYEAQSRELAHFLELLSQMQKDGKANNELLKTYVDQMKVNIDAQSEEHKVFLGALNNIAEKLIQLDLQESIAKMNVLQFTLSDLNVKIGVSTVQLQKAAGDLAALNENLEKLKQENAQFEAANARYKEENAKHAAVNDQLLENRRGFEAQLIKLASEVKEMSKIYSFSKIQKEFEKLSNEYSTVSHECAKA